jgi:organic radical activating enzyme
LISSKYLSYAIVSHCTLKCDGCGSKSELSSTKASFIPVETFKADIESAAKFMAVDEFIISGGEPLLHKSIIELIKIVKSSKIAKTVRMTTNGQLIDRQPEEFWQNIDKIVLSLYPNTPVDNDYVNSYVAEKCRKYNVELELNTPSDFMRIYASLDDKRDTQKVYNECKIAHEWGCHTLDRGRYYKCYGPIINKLEEDGVPIEETDVRNYLQSKTPLTSCYSCFGTSGPKIPHRQVTK